MESLDYLGHTISSEGISPGGKLDLYQLTHYHPNLQVVSCDASEMGLDAALFHRYADGSGRPIFNISKLLSKSRYSQIHKEALEIIYAVQKFHSYLYGRNFILMTDGKPLIFDPHEAVSKLTLNRLTWWALILQQCSYTIEYRKTADHGNMDV